MKQEKNFIVDVLFVLALFGVFTISALMLVTVGADVYRHTVDDMGRNYETRTSVAYITEKIRQNDTSLPGEDSQQSITIGTLSDTPALMMMRDIDGELYCTYLYLHDGYLKELFVKSGSYPGENALAAGQEIFSLKELSMEQPAPNLLSFELTTPDGENHSFCVSLRSSQ